VNRKPPLAREHTLDQGNKSQPVNGKPDALRYLARPGATPWGVVPHVTGDEGIVGVAQQSHSVALGWHHCAHLSEGRKEPLKSKAASVRAVQVAHGAIGRVLGPVID
jgi:hypothetical protein